MKSCSTGVFYFRRVLNYQLNFFNKYRIFEYLSHSLVSFGKYRFLVGPFPPSRCQTVNGWYIVFASCPLNVCRFCNDNFSHMPCISNACHLIFSLGLTKIEFFIDFLWDYFVLFLKVEAYIIDLIHLC